jgi:hypothetical protein
MLTKEILQRLLKNDNITLFKQLIKDREALLDTISEHTDFAKEIIDKITSSMALSNHFIKNKEDLDEITRHLPEPLNLKILKMILDNPKLFDLIYEHYNIAWILNLYPTYKDKILQRLFENPQFFQHAIWSIPHLTQFAKFPEYRSQLIEAYFQSEKPGKELKISWKRMAEAFPEHKSKLLDVILTNSELFESIVPNIIALEKFIESFPEYEDKIIEQWLAKLKHIGKIDDLNNTITLTHMNSHIKNKLINYLLKETPLFNALIMDCYSYTKLPYKFIDFVNVFSEFKSQIIDKWLQTPELVKAIMHDDEHAFFIGNAYPEYKNDINNSYLLHNYSPIEVINKAIATNNFKLIDKVNKSLVAKKLSTPKEQESWQVIGKELSEKIKTLDDTDPLKSYLTNLSATISTFLVSDLRTLSLFFVKKTKLNPSYLPGDLQCELDDIKEENASNYQLYD